MPWNTTVMNCICTPMQFSRGRAFFLIDDLIATGGTMSAAVELVEKAGGEVAKIAVVIELDNLGGRAALGKYAFDSLMVMN